MSLGEGHMDYGACHDCVRSSCLKELSIGFVDTQGVRIDLLSGKGRQFLLGL